DRIFFGALIMYRLTETSVVIRLSDNACIPADPENLDYARYMSWVSDGNEPEPYADPLPPQYPRFSAQQILDLFTEAERRAITEAAMVNVDVKMWYDRNLASDYVT